MDAPPAFRDYPRAHRDEAQRYEALKYALAARFPDDREAYTAAKTAYMAEIYRKIELRDGC